MRLMRLGALGLLSLLLSAGLLLADVSDAEAPRLAAHIADRGADAVAVAGNRLATGDYRGVRPFDIADPRHP